MRTASCFHPSPPPIQKTKGKLLASTAAAASYSIVKIRASASLLNPATAVSSIPPLTGACAPGKRGRLSMRPMPVSFYIAAFCMKLTIYLVDGETLEIDEPGTWTLEMLINKLASMLKVDASRIRLAYSGQILTRYNNQLQIQFKAGQTQSPIICNVMAVDPSSFGASASETGPLSEADEQCQALVDFGIPKEEASDWLAKAKGDANQAVSMWMAKGNQVKFSAAKEKDIRELMAFAKMDRDAVIAAYVANSEKLEETKQYLKNLRGH